MSATLPLIAVLLLAGCAAENPNGLRAIGGYRDATGARVGDYQIVNAAGVTQAKGYVIRGRMEGGWVFFDSRQTKIAEVRYADGIPTGPYRTYFGSAAFSADAGKPQTEGFMQNGRVEGQLIGYNRKDGSLYSRATFDITGVPKVLAGPPEAPARIAANDEHFIALLGATVRATLGPSSQIAGEAALH